MKKIYTTPAYKRIHRRRTISFRRRKKKYNAIRNAIYAPIVHVDFTAPCNFAFLENLEICATFFRSIRTYPYKKNERIIRIDMSGVEQIDFPAVMTLMGICDEMKDNHVNVTGNLPRNEECLKYILDSGFLKKKYNRHGKRYKIDGHADFMKLEKGSNRLTQSHLMNLLNLVRHASMHLAKNENVNDDLFSMVKEVCGNTIEWSDAYQNQWNLGAKFEENKVTFTAVDLGKGILESLVRKFDKMILDLIQLKGDVDVLGGAFDKKYGSTSKDSNRNKGLPSLKAAQENGIIKNLVVVTNNVALFFEDTQKNNKFASSKEAFCGTLYKWEVDLNCLQ